MQATLGTPGVSAAGCLARAGRSARAEDAVLRALHARLDAIESEIVRLTDLASATDDLNRQEEYWAMAQDLQRAAREIRAQLRPPSTMD
jgi:hypothetical protein